jgi:hypothetical protein
VTKRVLSTAPENIARRIKYRSGAQWAINGRKRNKHRAKELRKILQYKQLVRARSRLFEHQQAIGRIEAGLVKKKDVLVKLRQDVLDCETAWEQYKSKTSVR